MSAFDEQLAALSRRCERILTEGDLIAKLKRSEASGEPLRIKLGLDPTAPDVTLGHAVPLRVVRQFQELGHKAVLIIGDYTARVGDPSGVNTTRPVLLPKQIDANAETYIEQLGKVLLSDEEHLEIRRNGEWLGKLDLNDMIKLCGRKTVAQILERDDFRQRFDAAQDIRIHEFLYPLLQGYDSISIDADVEMGGSDQLFNNLVGREFQKHERPDDPLAGQVVIVTPLLVGTDGAVKMSKSKGNYIGVTDPPGGPDGMFGKIMSLPDALMASYFTLLTDLPRDEFDRLIAENPRDAKMRLAREIITWLHDEPAAHAAQREFENTIVRKQVPADIPELRVGPGPHKLAPLLKEAGFVKSNGEGVRKIKEGAVRLDGQKVSDFSQEFTFDRPTVLQMGNRRFVRLVAPRGD